MLFWEDGDDCNIVADYMIKNNLTGIVFSKYLGFIENEVLINRIFDFVDELHIIDSNIKNISFVFNFPNVKKMIIQNDDKTKLDINRFEQLEKLFLTWRKGVVNLFKNRSLKVIKLEDFKEKQLIDVDDDLKLEELWFSNSAIEDLSCLGKLKRLKKLNLDSLRCLEDSGWLEELIYLEELNISSCKRISTTILKNVGELRDLKRLYFSKMGEIPTITYISKLKQIEVIGFIEETKIVDGNLNPLLELPNLKKINIQGFKHYIPSIQNIKTGLSK